MKLYGKISGPFILMLISITISGQNNNCHIRRDFAIEKGTALRISNKYGDVNVVTTYDDSLSVCATITIVQDDNELVQKSLKLVTISINKLKDTVFVYTLYDKRFFSEEFRQGRKSFNIDYLIKTPSYIDLGVTNEFGNISIEELTGTLNVRLSQGILSAKKLTKGNIKPISAIYIDHGKVDIEESNWIIFTLLNCQSVNIENAQALMINSSISKIRIGDISSLVCNSKSDSYSIKSINNILSESAYTEYDIGKLNGQLKSKATYGSITISDLNKAFTGIDIFSNQSPVNLKTGKDISFKADIIVTDSPVDFPAAKFPGIIKAENNYSTTLLGTAGADNKTKSLIRIRATAGKLTIQ
jgi:hypothetical protein